MKAFVKGDLEGFFAFGLDTLLTYILLSTLCLEFLKFSPDLLFLRILPATAVGLVVGNLFYAWQALKLARLEGRDDVCAIPYGTSSITIVIYVFLIMFPTQQKALDVGFSKAEADIIAWHTGLLACMFSGMIEFFGAFIVNQIRRVTPRVVMLVAKAGTALAFLSMDYVLRTFTYPVLGFTSLVLVLAFYFGGVRVKGGIPSGFIILLVGTALAWGLSYTGVSPVTSFEPFNLDYAGFHLPLPELHRVFESLDFVVEFLPIVIPFGFIFLIGSLQNIESAAAAGDHYPPRPLLLTNGIGSFAAAAFGSPFPTTIFLGHPGYKALGARAGYSTLNASFWTFFCVTGLVTIFTRLIPIEAIMPIIIWLGIVICAQNFQVAHARHMPAIVIGLLPALAAYVALAVKHTLVVAGKLTDTRLMNPDTTEALVSMRNFYADGMFALSQGYIYSSMVWAAIAYHIIDRRFRQAAAWSAAGAVLSITGFIHAYKYSGTDVLGVFHFPMPVWNKWATGYLVITSLLLALPKLLRDHEVIPEPSRLPPTGAD